MPRDRENPRTIDRRGGTVLQSSRTNPAKMAKLPDHLADEDFPLSVSNKGIATNTWDVSKQVLANLSALGIEHLIAIGGDHTPRHAAKPKQPRREINAKPQKTGKERSQTPQHHSLSSARTP